MTGAGTMRFKDAKMGTPLPTACKNSTILVNLKSGSGLPGTDIGSIPSAAYRNCIWLLGYTATLTPSGFPWHLNALQYDSSTGVTHGTITGIHIGIVGPSCSAIIDGTSAGADNGRVAVTYTNSTHTLQVLTTGGNLHYYNVSGCFGQGNSGDPASISGSYTISSPQIVTSP